MEQQPGQLFPCGGFWSQGTWISTFTSCWGDAVQTPPIPHGFNSHLWFPAAPSALFSVSEGLGVSLAHRVPLWPVRHISYFPESITSTAVPGIGAVDESRQVLLGGTEEQPKDDISWGMLPRHIYCFKSSDFRAQAGPAACSTHVIWFSTCHWGAEGITAVVEALCDSRPSNPDMPSAQTCQGDLRAHSSITHVPHPIRAPGLLSRLWSAVLWDEHGKVGERWCFCRSIALKGWLNNNKKCEMNVCEKCQIGAWGVRLHLPEGCLHSPCQSSQYCTIPWHKVCSLLCFYVPILLSPAAEKESDCADGVRGCIGNTGKKCWLTLVLEMLKNCKKLEWF